MKTNPSPHCSYVRFSLRTESLTEICRKRLEKNGVACVEEGHPFEAYGIIDDTAIWPSLIRQLKHDPDIQDLELGEPPSSK